MRKASLWKAIQSKGNPFSVPSPLDERLMVPAKYVEELQRLTKSDWPIILSVNLGQDRIPIETLLCGGKASRADYVPNLDRFGEIHS